MRTIIAIDPGTLESAVVVWDGAAILDHFIKPNTEVLSYLRYSADIDYQLVIEKVVSYGMSVGESTFETVLWSGRFAEAWDHRRGNWDRLPRMDVKMFWCHSAKAKDTNIWQAMVDRFGEPGKKATPGFLYEIRSHSRAALALAVAYAERSG